jgi:transcriptional regulator with XRE-family HTH domain/KaiC/GvpD/RAD55 family RecA-like ATPase
LDRMLDGLYIGDNVVWHDESGSLAGAFCLKFIETSMTEQRPVVYVSFDRSPRNLVDKLGSLANNPYLTILDCFSSGKGGSSPVFVKFYEDVAPRLTCQIRKVAEPQRMDELMDILYSCHAGHSEDVRFVFESLTGMQELWGGEESIVRFYTHSCPRLYELNTIAYWIMEKTAHSQRARAQINQIAQVVIELKVKRGTTSLSVIKAEKRSMDGLNRPSTYWIKDAGIVFDEEKRSGTGIDLGMKLKELRTKCGLSQTELARMIGVTPSNISQIESNLIYPSIPALLKIAEILAVDISSFFQETSQGKKRTVFPFSDAMEIRVPDLPEGAVYAKRLLPADVNPKGEPYLVEIPADQILQSHFFAHKGEELGYLISGELQMKVGSETHTVRAGDVILLESHNPGQWKNIGVEPAKLLWIKIRT